MATAPRHLLLCATRKAAGALSELVEAWRSASVHVELEHFISATPDVSALVAEHCPDEHSHGPPRRALSTGTGSVSRTLM